MKNAALFLMGYLFILSVSCKKDNNSSGSGNEDVYVAGFDNGSLMYWKNGTGNFLSFAAPGYYGNALGITVNNGDVYVAGYVGDTAVYWKNGSENYLSNPDFGTAAATSITSSGSDIYIGGFGQTNSGNGLLYWKNGLQNIADSYNSTIGNTSIAVSGNDVYLAATLDLDNGIYWKNGVTTSFGIPSYAYGIAVSGTDVYVVGGGGTPITAGYWKNGTFTALPSTAETSAAYGITITGSDVYICGVDNGNAVYWKNGAENILEVGAADAIAVSGSDVYVAGYAYVPQTQYAAYWKNGVRTRFAASPPGTLATEECHAIVLVSH